jgi:murein L,D-transpeptidase YcbB/YkuD
MAGIFSAPLNAGEQQVPSEPTAPTSWQTQRLKAYLDARTDELRDDREAALAELIDTFYDRREYRHAWAQPPSLTAARELLVRIAASHEDGLCPMRYDVPWLRDRLAPTHPFSAGDGAVLDVDLSIALLRYALHMALGHPAGEDRASSVRATDVLQTFDDMRAPTTLRAALRSLEPQHREYRELRTALTELRAVVLRGGWPSVDAELWLEPGDTADAATLQTLVERLRSSGDLGGEWPGAEDDGVYGGVLVEAVRRFQRRHGLVRDGIVGPRTVTALNVPASARLEQIEINMDRWRRVPDNLGSTHVRVNIPEFRLRVFEDGESRLRMRTIVGAPETQTPVFSDRIRYLVFNPYWNVPDSIVRNEIAVTAAEDPARLEEQGFEVLNGWDDDAEAIDPSAVDWEADRIGYRVRQRPGPENALGLVKFMFPNRYSVYLHDTPARSRFENTRRAFSHGCVRVADPNALAEVLLSTTDAWPAERIAQAMDAREREAVPLNTPVPVHLLYFTAWVDGEGAIHFRDDIYGRDRGARAWLGCRGEGPPGHREDS